MLDYPKLITESAAELLELEKSIGKARWRDHVRFLRVLKTGQARSVRAAGEIVGLGLRQSQRLWRRYQKAGLAGFGDSPYSGRVPKLAAEQEATLKQRLQQDDISTLAEAQRLLREEFGVQHGISGVWVLFRRLGIKLKTGRPTNVRKDPEAEPAFKKTSRRS